MVHFVSRFTCLLLFVMVQKMEIYVRRVRVVKTQGVALQEVILVRRWSTHYRF